MNFFIILKTLFIETNKDSNDRWKLKDPKNFFSTHSDMVVEHKRKSPKQTQEEFRIKQNTQERRKKYFTQ